MLRQSVLNNEILAYASTFDFDSDGPKPYAKFGIGPQLSVWAAEPKAGKSIIAGSLPDSITLDIGDNGCQFFTNKARNYELHEWQRMLSDISQITARNDAFKAGTVDKPACTFLIIGNLTGLDHMLWYMATFLYRNTSIGKNFSGTSVEELPQGAGYQWHRHALNLVIDMLQKAAPHVICLGHIKDKYLGKDVEHEKATLDKTTMEGRITSCSKMLNMTGQAAVIIVTRADAFAKLYMEGKGKNSKRLLAFISSEEIPETQCRVPHLSNEKFVVSELVGEGNISRTLRCYPHKIYPSCFPDLFTLDEDGDFVMDTSKITGNIFPTA